MKKVALATTVLGLLLSTETFSGIAASMDKCTWWEWPEHTERLKGTGIRIKHAKLTKNSGETYKLCIEYQNPNCNTKGYVYSSAVRVRILMGNGSIIDTANLYLVGNGTEARRCREFRGDFGYSCRSLSLDTSASRQCIRRKAELAPKGTGNEIEYVPNTEGNVEKVWKGLDFAN